MRNFGKITDLAYEASGAIENLSRAVDESNDSTLQEAFERHMQYQEAAHLLDDWEKVVNTVYHGLDSYDKGKLLEDNEILQDLPQVQILDADELEEQWKVRVIWHDVAREAIATHSGIWWMGQEIDQAKDWPDYVSNVKAAVIHFAVRHWDER